MLRMILSLALLMASPAVAKTSIATVAGGCFWCVEADFESVPGVKGVISGFTGGKTRNPTYEEVKGGKTGHYEAAQIFYDPARISYEQIIELFFRSVDPTDAGGQFCDRGSSYRTAIFVKSAAEKAAAEAAKVKAQAALGRKVATMILPAGPFYKAGEEHQNYYRGKHIVLTRRGLKTQAGAYAFYRKACGRDQRVKQLWGSAAPFTR